MPILGIMASQLSLGSQAFESIQTFTVGSGGTSSITFGSGGTIPQEYKHLQIRGISNNTASSSAFIYMSFNGDTSTNYNWHELSGNGTNATAGSSSSFTGTVTNNMGLGTNDTSAFGAAVIDILDYTNTSKYKTTRSISGFDGNTLGIVCIDSNLWRVSSAITSITMTYAGGNFAQHSTFALYGIKG
jgi:hypothetical protein